MTYEESVRYLLALGKELSAPRQARVQKYDLVNIHALAEALGSPQRAVRCAHIAGTNGKGSTAAFLDSILRVAGLRTGLYTSPHLVRITERIRIGGEEISPAQFAATFTRLQREMERLLASGTLPAHPTYFECLTALAFLFFAENGAEFSVYEVGMGGRLDATNVIAPEISVITQIDFDHEDHLGHSIPEIAAEKAAIIKADGWVVSAAERPEAQAVIRRRAAEQQGHLIEIDSAYRIERLESHEGRYRAWIQTLASGEQMALELPMAGRFQVRNALAAAAAAQVLAERGLPISSQMIEHGIRTTRWPGRLERINERPAVFLDGAHNPAAARELALFWAEQFAGSRLVLVYGAMRDKALDEIAGVLFPCVAGVILTEPKQSRAISARALGEMTGHLGRHVEVVPDTGAALERAMDWAGPGGAVFATGSLYLVGDLRAYWEERKGRTLSTGVS